MHFLITITQKELQNDFEQFFMKNGVNTIFVTSAHGTAQKKLLDLLGIEKTEKAVLFSVVSGIAEKIIHKLIYDMNIDIPGNGVSIAIPVSGIGGQTTLKYLTDGQSKNNGDEKIMNESHFSLIIVITEKGSIEAVMDAARTVGATGGTAIHAKGTGSEFAEKFFGITIASEKELIFIIAKNELRDAIMSEIMTKCGMNTDAHAAVFSVPVDKAAGLRELTKSD